MDHNGIDVPRMIVTYNLVVAVLLMLASARVASIAGILGGSRAVLVKRYVEVAVFTFGAVVTCLMSALLITFFIV
jgi:hypothetical protein